MNALWNDDEYVAFDLETSGELREFALQPWRLKYGRAWITSIAWVYREGGVMKTGGDTYPDYLLIACFLQWCVDEGKTLVGWNIQFDLQWLVAMGFKHLVDQLRFIDGMLVWRHLEIEPEYDESGRTKKSYGLKIAVAEHLPKYAGYQIDIDFHDDSPEGLARLHAYNIQDCVFTLRLTRKFYLLLGPRQRQAMWIEAQCLGMIAVANCEGMPIDTLGARALSASLKATAKARLASLGPHGVTEKIVRSPLQLSKLLYDQWLLPVLKTNTSKLTGKTTRSTDKTVLHELAFIDPRAKELREYREALNNDTKFAEGPVAAVDYCEDGDRAHPQARVFGTYSGRLTYSSKQGRNKDERPIGWAIHQSKKGEKFRGVLVAPPGYTIVELDAAGQEFKIMAIASNDLTMLQLCQPGEDPHGFMGAKITRNDYRAMVAAVAAGDKGAKSNRQLGKVANLCIAKGEIVLTDRGPCSIEHVRRDDLVWDGEAFVAHDGVSFSGIREVIDNDGVMATPSHHVMVNQEWVAHDEAQRMGWAIDRACTARHALRIMGGLARRAVREVWRDLRDGAMCLWDRTRSQPAVHGDGAIFAVQGLCFAPATSPGRRVDCDRRRDEALAEARQRMVSALRKSEGSLMAKLRGAWDQVPVRVCAGGSGVHQTNSNASNLPQARHRPQRQRWSLRAWKSALGYAQSEPRQSQIVETFDIVNCGPRTRYAINGRIVHNSLQYRTSAKKLRVVARVDYGIPMNEPDAYMIHSTYQSTYHRVPEYWDRQIALVSRVGYVETFAGRRVQVTGNWNGDRAWSMGSTAINYRIQGTGADQKYLALMMIRDYLTTIGARFFFDLHDGIYLLVPDRYAKTAAAHLQHELNNLPYATCWGFLPPVPLTWDCKTGKTWGTLTDFKP